MKAQWKESFEFKDGWYGKRYRYFEKGEANQVVYRRQPRLYWKPIDWLGRILMHYARRVDIFAGKKMCGDYYDHERYIIEQMNYERKHK